MEQYKLGDSTSKAASDLIAAIALGTALLAIAAASILTVVAQYAVGSNATTFNRLAIAAIAFSVWNGVSFASQRITKAQLSFTYTLRDFGLLCLGGVSFAASLTLWAWSLKQTSVANSTLLNNMMPIFTTLGGWLLLKQQFQPRFLLGMTVAIFGAIAICVEDLQLAGNGLFGDLAALLAAMFSAISILSLEQLRMRFSTPLVMLGTTLVGSLFILPIALLSEEHLFPTSGESWLAVICLALIAQVLGQGLLTYSLKRFSASLLAVAMLTIPAIAAILAAMIFSEKLQPLNWVAFAIVLAGVYLAVSTPRIQKHQT